MRGLRRFFGSLLGKDPKPSAPAGAPRTKKITATARSETIRYSSACTAFLHVTTRAVAATATTHEM